VVVNDEDIVDVAIGDSHMLILTATEGTVYCIGSNRNGQLGLGGRVQSVDAWTAPEIRLGHKQRVLSVTAGSKTSFAIVRNDDEFQS
jgi:alpha-tubulin suppressor-like RCC1 family protein